MSVVSMCCRWAGRIVILLLLVSQLSLVTGCRDRAKKETAEKQRGDSASRSESGRQPEFVTVTGSVVKPASIELRSESLTLKDAVLWAGGPQISDLESGRGDRVEQLVLVLSRQDKRWYIPWGVIDNEALGQTPIAGGSSIALKLPGELNLDMDQTVPSGASFEVAGLVERAGQFTTKAPSEKFMQILTPEYAGAATVDGEQADTVILTRQSPGKTATEVYLIPIGNAFVQAELLRFRIQPNDRLEFVRLEDVRALPKTE